MTATLTLPQDDRVPALLWALSHAETSVPDGPALVLRGPAHPDLLPALAGREASWVTPIRTEFEALTALGLAPVAVAPDRHVAWAVVFLTQHRLENFGLIAAALTRLAPNGVLTLAGTNLLGAGSYERELTRAGLVVETQSKHKCRIALVIRPPELPKAVLEWTGAAAPHPVAGTDLQAMPGLFSSGHPDPGSALLARHLPILSGKVGDWGAGWGFLSAAVLATAQDLTELHLVDADSRGLQLAIEGLGPTAAGRGVALESHWMDATRPTGLRSLDAIVTNPPFHDRSQHAVSVGLSFVDSAAAALRGAGRLYLVSLRTLPFSAHLEQLFARVRIRASEGGYAVYEADHPRPVRRPSA